MKFVTTQRYIGHIAYSTAIVVLQLHGTNYKVPHTTAHSIFNSVKRTIYSILI